VKDLTDMPITFPVPDRFEPTLAEWHTGDIATTAA